MTAERSVVVVGAGPRATGLLERIAANSGALWGQRQLRIHLIDPFPPGPGRIWRHEQSPLLRMNSMAEDVTMFTDETSTIEGPVRPGPSLAQWATQFAGGVPRFTPYAEPPDPAVKRELAGLAPTDFATRRAQSAYLHWVFRRTLADLPPRIRVEHHLTTATAITGSPDGPQSVWLAGEVMPLRADLVVLTQGHLRSGSAPEHEELERFALDHGRFYLPPDFSDADLSGIRPGEDVIMRGLGLAFVDLAAMLTEGRGGSYREEPDGTLTYLPSGREPVLHVGSRRGVPYHSKTGYRLIGPRPPLPRYFGPAEAEKLSVHEDRIELRRDLWPLMAKEIGFGHYHELFHAHPERTAMDWPRFLAAYDGLDWYSPGMADLVGRAVPEPADRLDFEALDRPLEGRVFAGPEQFQAHMRDHVANDVSRRQDAGHSADLGAFLALLSIYGQLPAFVATGKLSARSVSRELDGWWRGFFSFLASGPPAFRLRQLLALSRAGLVCFLGADVKVHADPVTGTFTAWSPTVPEHRVRATALVEAYLPSTSLRRTCDPLLRVLREAGEVSEEVLRDGTHVHRSGLISIAAPYGQVVDPTLGGPHPRRIALGAHTNGRAIAAFARPRTDAPAFRQNDATARMILRTLA